MQKVTIRTTLGVTTVQRGDGSTVAIAIRPIPAATPLGLSPFDLAPGPTMTNAMLEGQAVSVSGSELVLKYKSGTVRVQVSTNGVKPTQQVGVPGGGQCADTPI